MSNQQNQPSQRRVIMDPHNYQRPTPTGTRPRPVQDIRQTKEYKVAARRWLSTIVALPILMYTSYMLFERSYGNKSQRRLPSTTPSASLCSGEESKKEDGN